MSIWKWAALIVALLALTVSLLNGSWLAPAPAGKLMLIAHRGIVQPLREGADPAACAAANMAPNEHMFIENSIFAIQHAAREGADAIAVDVQATKDGRMAVFADSELDCRTDGKGALRDRTMAELKRLDIGHGYTADGGKTFPLRGRGVGAMPAVEDLLERVPGKQIIFSFAGSDPREADLLIAAFKRAGMEPGERFGFFGDAAVIARIKALAPGAWAFSRQEIGACLPAYFKTGWTGIVPEPCRDTTIAIPLANQWRNWGWPNRFLARVNGAGSRTILAADVTGGAIAGIARPDQLAEVPRGYRGYLWVEDYYNIGRSLGR